MYGSNGLSGGLLACWTNNVMIRNVVTTQFCIELECSKSQGTCIFWSIFMYSSTDVHGRQQQWDYLVKEMPKWRDMWFLVGDFNDIRTHEEKRRGIRRSDSSF